MVAVILASGILPGCKEKLFPETVGGLQLALPAWPEHGRQPEPDCGHLERRDARGDKAAVLWDMDPRPGPVTAVEARAALGEEAEATATVQVAGHSALLLRTAHGTAAVWRCDISRRLLRAVAEGPHAPQAADLAAQVRCHGIAVTGNGDVPAPSSSVLGAGWRFGARGRGSISWLRDDAVLTYFAGQQMAGPRDAGAARKAALAWAAAAGLSKAEADDAQPAPGPHGHPGLLVHGKAALDGRPVRWSLIFWRCLQRQKSFAAIVFSQAPPDDSSLLSARCHG